MLLHSTTQGQGPRLLLLHPVGLHGGFLANLAHTLSSRFTVMRIDLRGHGQSPLEPLALSMGDFADDVHETLIAQDFAPCAVAGFSFGSMTAQELAIRHPNAVSALMAMAGPCTFDDATRPLLAARGTDALRDGMGAVIDATMERWFTPGFRHSAAALEARRHLLETDPRGWAQGWNAIAALDTESRLPQLRIPVLCVAGEQDVSSPPAAVRRISAAVPGARYQEVPGAPHMIFIEQPEATARAITAFLDSLHAGARQR